MMDMLAHPYAWYKRARKEPFYASATSHRHKHSGLEGLRQVRNLLDITTPAFGIRVGKRSKTFVVVRGKSRERVTIGRYPDLSLADARAKAKKLLSTEQEPKTPRITFAEAKDEFLEDNYRHSASDWPGIVKLIFSKHFSALNDKRLGQITDADVSRYWTAGNCVFPERDWISENRCPEETLLTVRTFAHRFETSVDVATAPERLFEELDDHRRLSAHMMQSSMMMAGNSMVFEFDDADGRAVGSLIRMRGEMLGLTLEVEEVITERHLSERKTWETIGEPRLLVIGNYRMGFVISPVGEQSRLTVFIDYDDPPPPWSLVAWLLGPVYARWCTTRIAKGAAHTFSGGARPPPLSPHSA